MYNYDDWDEPQKGSMKDELWTVEEVAERWRVSARTVRAMLQRGNIPGIKIGMNWRIYLSDVMRYEQQQNPMSGAHTRPTATVRPMPKPVVMKIS